MSNDINIGFIYDDYNNLTDQFVNGNPYKEIEYYYSQIPGEMGQIRSVEVETDHGNTLNKGYEYDNYGRIIQLSESYAGNSVNILYHNYDQADLPEKQEITYSQFSPSVSYNFDYDNGSRLKSKEILFGSDKISTIGYTYTPAIQRNSIEYFGQSNDLLHEDRFYYNSRGWLRQINSLDGPTTYPDWKTNYPYQALTPPSESQTHDLQHEILIMFNFDSLKFSSTSHFRVDYNIESYLYNPDESLVLHESSKMGSHFLKYSGDSIISYPYTDTVFALGSGYIEQNNFIEHVKNSVNFHVESVLGHGIQEEEYLLGFGGNSISARAIHWLKTRIETDLRNLIPRDNPFEEEGSCNIFYQQMFFDRSNQQLNAPAQYNGNIAHMEWVIADSEMRKYGYGYDNFDRIERSTYIENGNLQANYSTVYSYHDFAGNLKSISRVGLLNPGGGNPVYGLIDDLQFTIQGNKLSSVVENSGPIGYDLGYVGQGTTMGYDIHGNLTSCSNRSINNIDYNHRHQPIEIFDQGNPVLKIAYDELGIKLEQTYYENSQISDSYTYLGNAIFFNGEFLSYNFGEGRIIKQGNQSNSWQVEFIIRDHLSNSRVWISDLNGDGHIDCEEETLQVKPARPLSRFTPSKVPQTFGFAAFDHTAKLHCVNPFGMPHDLPEEADLPTLPYRDSDPFTYNDKEYEDRVTKMYDYHARWYDAALGRWGVVDPLASDMPSWSPYNYVFNNPINLIDPLGLSPESPDWEWRINSQTGEKEKIGDKGGDTEQYIYWDNDKTHSDVLSGSEVHVGPVAKDWYSDGDTEYAVHSVDLWADVPDEYQGAYTKFDLANRYNAMRKGDYNDIAGQESTGMARRDMIWNLDDYGRYLDNKYGSRAGYVMAIDGGLIRTMLGYGTGRGLNKALGGLKKMPQSAGAFSPAFKPRPMTWPQFRSANKGRFKGKDHMKKAGAAYQKYKASF